MATIKLQHFTSLNDANKQLIILSSPNGSMTRLLQTVSINNDIPVFKKPLIDLRKITGEPLKAYLSEVLKIQNDIQTLTASPNANRDAEQYATKLLSGSGGDTELYRSMIAANMLSNRIDDAPTKIAVQHFLLQPIRESWRIILHTATRGLEQQWQSQIIHEYQQNIAAKFPFDRFATRDTTINDVTDFLQPQTGVLWVFVNTYLKPFLSYNLNGWQEQKWLGIGPNFAPQFLTALTKIKAISADLFSNNDNQPRFNYQIYPEPTPGLSQIIFAANNNTYHYRNDPQEWQNFSWSGNTLAQTTYLSIVTANGATSKIIQAPGTWGVFHVINKGQLQPQQNSIYRITWHLKTNHKIYLINMLLRTNGKNNIFQELLLNKFTLPWQLLGDPEHLTEPKP